jgi:predicted component of type VI protein secretion system
MKVIAKTEHFEPRISTRCGTTIDFNESDENSQYSIDLTASERP